MATADVSVSTTVWGALVVKADSKLVVASPGLFNAAASSPKVSYASGAPLIKLVMRDCKSELVAFNPRAVLKV